MFPQQLGGFRGADPADHLLLHQQHIADVAQQHLAGDAGPPVFAQARGQRLDPVEEVADPRLVVGKHEALGEDVGDQLQPLG